MSKQYDAKDIQAHNSEENGAWIIIHGGVYDVTSFLEEHPGGKKMLIRVAGKDASKQFDQFHNEKILKSIGGPLQIGTVGKGNAVDTSPPKKETHKPAPKQSSSTTASIKPPNKMEPFGSLIPYAEPAWYRTHYSPYINASHLKLRNALRKFIDEELIDRMDEFENAGEVPQDVYDRIAKTGLLAGAITMACPKVKKYVDKVEILGSGVTCGELDYFHDLVINDELSRTACNGFLQNVFAGNMIGLPPVLNYGSEKMADEIAPDVLLGKKRICLAITEPSAGSDVAGIRTTARKTSDGKHYIVNGEKKWITTAIWSDYMSVAVRTGEQEARGKALSFLLIPTNLPGITRRRMRMQGSLCGGTTYISFEDVKVPAENLMGQREGDGFKQVLSNFNHERVMVVIQGLRFSRVCLEETIKYAAKREVSGATLLSRDLIQFKLAHCARQVEGLQNWLENVIFQMQNMDYATQNATLGGETALLKAHTSLVLELCSREANQIFGGLSYTKGGQGERVERIARDVTAFAIPAGSEDVLLMLGIRQAVKISNGLGAKL